MTGRVLLIGWELGAGSGHLARLVPIIDAFLKRGWTVVAAMRDVVMARAVFSRFTARATGGRFVLAQAPIFTHRTKSPTSPRSLPEILLNIGFGDPGLVQGLVSLWQSLLAKLRPALVLSDSAPGLNLAARGRVPVIVLGNGWTVPPDTAAVPPLPHVKSNAAAAEAAAMRICDSASTVLGGNPAITRLCDILRGDENFVCTLSLLDPYREARDEPLFWPPEIARSEPNEHDSPRNGLIYLPRDHPAIGQVFTAAAHSSLRFSAYLGGATAPGPPNVLISQVPINFTAALPRARFILHHGGLGTATWGLAHGLPQITFPADIEKLITARAIEAARSGVALTVRTSTADIVWAFDTAGDLTPPALDYRKLMSRTASETVREIVRAAEAYAGSHRRRNE